MNAPAFAVTVLRALAGKRLVKIFATDRQGRVIKSAYDSPKWFTSSVVDVKTVDGLADLLGRLQKHSDACIIMGALGKWHPGRRATGPARQWPDLSGPLSAKLRELRAYAAYRGFVVTREYVDQASDDVRRRRRAPEFEALMADARRRRFDG